MIDFYFETETGAKRLPWATLCERCGIDFYMPTTWELVMIRDQLAEREGVSADQIEIRQNGLAIL